MRATLERQCLEDIIIILKDASSVKDASPETVHTRMRIALKIAEARLAKITELPKKHGRKPKMVSGKVVNFENSTE
jgi:hypothetical protein